MVKRKTVILVVEERKEIRESLRNHLKLDFVVITAESCEEALPIIIGYKPEILLLDHGLTGMNCMELLMLIREFNKTIKVIMMMGPAGVLKNEQQFEKLKIHKYIRKPINLPELDSAILTANSFL